MSSASALNCMTPRFATAIWACRVIRSLRFFNTSLFMATCLLDSFSLGFSSMINVIHLVAHVFDSNLEASFQQGHANPHPPRITALAGLVVIKGFPWICQNLE